MAEYMREGEIVRLPPGMELSPLVRPLKDRIRDYVVHLRVREELGDYPIADGGGYVLHPGIDLEGIEQLKRPRPLRLRLVGDVDAGFDAPE